MAMYTTHEAAELAGVRYQRLWYALATGKLHETRRSGRVRLFDDGGVVDIMRHFRIRRDVIVAEKTETSA